jgi:hypothetical protein
MNFEQSKIGVLAIATRSPILTRLTKSLLTSWSVATARIGVCSDELTPS